MDHERQHLDAGCGASQNDGPAATAVDNLLRPGHYRVPGAGDVRADRVVEDLRGDLIPGLRHADSRVSHDHVQAAKNFHKSTAEWFDVSQFVLQPFGFPGNAGRNQLFAPAEKRIDFSLFRDFVIRESTKLQFRAESFNLTNTPNFGTPNNQISSFAGGVGSRATNAGGFGSITSSNTLYNPREIQFALKLVF